MTEVVNLPYPIRLAIEADAPELARLFTLLGHPTKADTIVALWQDWQSEGNHALVSEKPDGTLAGVVTLHQMTVLHRLHPVGRITSLVVDEQSRQKGIGRALVAAAEASLTRSGCGLLEITSNLRLVEAHAFYEHLGYKRTSIRLAKVLTRAD